MTETEFCPACMWLPAQVLFTKKYSAELSHTQGKLKRTTGFTIYDH